MLLITQLIPERLGGRVVVVVVVVVAVAAAGAHGWWRREAAAPDSGAGRCVGSIWSISPVRFVLLARHTLNCYAVMFAKTNFPCA